MLIGEPGYFDGHECSDCYLAVLDNKSDRKLDGWWNFRNNNTELVIGQWEDDLNFHEETKILRDTKEKLSFVYACLHNDNELAALVRQIFKEYYTGDKENINFDTLKISVNPNRCVNKNYIYAWKQTFPEMSDEEFIIDFILNNKYVVICDHPEGILDQVQDLGLLSDAVKIY